jgi:uncharacterized protein (TIGR02453 family)
VKTPFTDATLEFLAELSLHNERPWFQANKARYETEVLRPLHEYVVEGSLECEAVGLPIKGDPKNSVYRIYRDVRFSNDKSPYKTFASALLTRNGMKHGEGVLYLHVDPAGPFFACGFYEPRKEVLQGFRKTMVQDPEAWQEVISRVPELSRDGALTRVPKGFESHKGSELESSLQLKHFIATLPLEPEELFAADLPAKGSAFALRCQPLLEWGWKVSDSLGLITED